LTGSLTLVLLPGLDGTGVLFRPLVAELPPTVRPLVISYPDDTPLGYRELLPLVLSSLPTSEPFVLLGESFSGPLALLAAATHPPGLCGVILCASFVTCPHRFVPRVAAFLIQPFALRLFPALTQVKALLGAYSTPALRDLSAEALSKVAPAVLAHRLRAVLRVDVTKELEACDIPLLYIRAEHDCVVPEANLRAIRRHQPHVRVASLPAPHMVLQTRPDLAARTISTFLAQCTEAEDRHSDTAG
jgi:pimeloyl-ACP methyl ester carboxylesterase